MDLSVQITNWLKNYLIKNNLNCFVIGVSGGVDSALTSTLCALSGEKTIVVNLPIKQNIEQYNLSNRHIEWLKKSFKNVESIEVDLTSVFETFESKFEKSTPLSLANTKSRLRMLSLYHISSINNGIVVGTGNKVEDFGVGFFTKYGDGGVDISPIADLLKSEVRDLARNLGVIEDILTANPTDGLWEDDRTDEQQIGASYEELEWAMEFSSDETKMTDRQKEVYLIFKKFNYINQHKIRPIPIFKKNENN
jgi:NAD+ synthase